MRVGVVVGRFQVPQLHDGHRRFLNYVGTLCDQLVILVGCSPAVPTKRNPLDFPTRFQMLHTEFPGAIVWPIEDDEDDGVWSAKLDQMLKPLGDSITLYGCRDSFLPHYRGGLRQVEVGTKELHDCSENATRLRDLCTQPTDSSDFRKGVVYSQNRSRPRICPTVDIAVVYDGSLLLGRKPNEVSWRFPGGFVDSLDKCLEGAARRELSEETRIRCTESDLKYVCSLELPDWRYREENKILTTLFVLSLDSGQHATAGDDLAEVRWFTLSKAYAPINYLHGPLLASLRNFLTVK